MLLPIVVMVLGLSDGPAVAGQVAVDPAGTIEAQTPAVLPVVPDTDVPMDTSAGVLAAAQEERNTTEPQDTPETKKPPTPPHTGLHALFGGVVDDFKNLPSLTNMYILLAGGGVALAA